MLPDEVRERVTGYIQHQAMKSREAIGDLVAGSQQKYYDIISGVTEQASAAKPAPDEWCHRELVRHVIGAQDAVRLLVHHMSRGEMPPPSDGPRGIGMMIADDERPFAALLEQLEQVNAGMLQAIRDMPTEANLELKSPHPFFGPLNAPEWAVFQRVHDEDHAQHAQKIIAATG
jgi:hypothetical protein